MYEYKAKIVRVIDGDTVDALVDLGFETHVHRRLRLFGIDAPEIRGPSREHGEAAKEYLASLVDQCEVLVSTTRDKREKYGRYLAKIYVPDKEGLLLLDVCAALVYEGHAKYFDPHE